MNNASLSCHINCSGGCIVSRTVFFFTFDVMPVLLLIKMFLTSYFTFIMFGFCSFFFALQITFLVCKIMLLGAENKKPLFSSFFGERK